MQRIYTNRGFARRMNISAAVVAFSILFGFWELWAALESAGDGYGYLFAALFIGGGLYATRQMLNDYADTVVAIDTDAAGGRAVVSVWRPFVSRRIEGGLDRLKSWRFEVKAERSLRIPMLLADHPDRKRPLKLELGRGIAVSEELRALAPKAVAAFERSAKAG